MRGHIRRRGKASWAVVLDLGRDANGMRRQKWHSVKGTRKDAERELGRLLNEINTGAYVEPARLTVAEYLEKWLGDYARPNVAPKTYERYAAIIRSQIVPEIGSTVLPRLSPLHIQSMYSRALANGRKDGKGGLSPRSVIHMHRVLHKAFDQAVKWQLIARNPAQAVEPPRAERREMRALDERELAGLIHRVENTRLYIPVLLAITTGLRRGEILALRWRDIDLKTGSLTVIQSLEQTKNGLRFKTPKTHRSRRSLALPELTVAALRTHRAKQAEQRLSIGPLYEDGDLVCASPDGRPWPPDSFSTAFASTVRRSSFKHFRFHDLRHSHATQLLKAGVHPKVVSERLGHSGIGITLDTYSHVMPGMQEDAAERIDASLRVALSAGFQGGSKPD